MNDAQTNVSAAEPGEVGFVQPEDFHSKGPFTFECGRTLPQITLRFETYGRLNAERNNAILICHALSGDHHVAGIHSIRDKKPGWWNHVVGPGKAIDTSRYFVVCSNCLGGCVGSTGPSSINPETGRRYGLDFPPVTIRDMVRAQRLLLESLDIRKLHAVVGGSMGGMQALQWTVEYPEYVGKVLALATTSRQGPQAIAFNEVGRQAILQDPGFAGGNYEPGAGPKVGLAIARMMAHITYLSDRGMDQKFGRRPVAASKIAAAPAETEAPAGGSFDPVFQVETYLRHQGQSFINRFDANTYLYFTRALDFFDLSGAQGSLESAFAGVRSETLVIGFTTDWLFPTEQNREIVIALLRAGKQASYAELAMDLGHDSFLLESPQLYDLMAGFLNQRSHA